MAKEDDDLELPVEETPEEGTRRKKEELINLEASKLPASGPPKFQGPPAEPLSRSLKTGEGDVTLSDIPESAKVTMVTAAKSPEKFISKHVPPGEIKALIDEYSPRGAREDYYNLFFHESRYNPNAVSKTGATGVGQLTQGTAANYGVTDRRVARQNVRGSIEFSEDNRAALRSFLGREPSGTELVMAYQQGLGGAKQIISGQISPKVAQNLRLNNIDPSWPPAKIIQYMANFYGTNTKAGSLPNAPGNLPASYLNAEPIATQPIKVEGGGAPQTKQEQARMAALMTGTPIDQITDLARRMDAATAKSTMGGGTRRMIPRVGVSQERVPVQGQLPVRVNQTETLPIPGITPTPGQTALRDATNPSVLSTIMTTMGQFDDARAIEAKRRDDLGVFGRIAEANELKNKKYGLDKPMNWDMDTAGRLWNAWSGESDEVVKNLVETVKNTPDMVRGLASGVTQLPANVAGGYVMPTAAFVATQTGGDKGKDLVEFGAQLQKDSEDIAHETFGKPTTPEGEAFEKIGRNFIGFSPWGLVATTMGVGMEYANPYLVPWLAGKLPDIPDVTGNLNPVGTAQAADTKVPVPTQNGTQLVSKDQMKVLGWAGALGIGFLVAPRGYSWAKAQIVYRQPWSSQLFDPTRNVLSTVGPGDATIAMSNMSDYIKANTLSTRSALLDIRERIKIREDITHARQSFQATGRSGINPIASEHVASTLDMYTNGGMRNAIDSAVHHGEMHTPEIQFRVQNSIRQLSEAAREVPDFREYIRLRILHDELMHNEVQYSNLSTGRQATTNIRRSIDDPINNRSYNLTTVSQAITAIEQTNPQIRQLHQGYIENIREGQRVISDGRFAPQNAQQLMDATLYRPNSPVFSATPRTGSRITDRIIAGDDPLFILETEVRRAIETRMKNEAQLTYIEDVGEGSFFTPRNQRWLERKGTSVNDSLLRIRVDGEVHHWTTDPLIVGLWKLEPASSGVMGALFERPKSWFQSATTGILAPYFATKSAWNTWMQQLLTAPEGSRAVWTPTHMVTEPVRQLYERRLAAAWGPALHDFSQYLQGTTLGTVAGQHLNTLANVMMRHAADNFYRRLERSGGVQQGWIQNAEDYVHHLNRARTQANNPQMAPIWDYLERTMRFGRGIIDGYTATNRAFAESAQYAWARKNQNMIDPATNLPIDPAKLAAKMFRLTGNPLERGRGVWKDAKGKDVWLPFESHTATSRAARTAVRGLGWANDAYRSMTPWAGVIVQSPTATMNAYMENPLKFGALMAATQILPESAAFLWNHIQGKEYVDYMMDKRSDQMKLNSTYWAIPGKKPWHGVELPNFQETAVARHMTRTVWDHMLGRNTFSANEDMIQAFWGLVDTNFKPAIPVPFSAALAATGVVMPSGIGGKAFVGRDPGFGELGQREGWMERMFRAVSPDLADISSQFQMGASGADGWGDKIKAGTKQAATRLAERTTIARDIATVLTGQEIKPQPSGASRVTEKLYEYRDFIKQANDYYRDEIEHKASVNLKGASKGGMGAIQKDFGDLFLPGTGGRQPTPGVQQKTPTNPLFLKVMDQMEKSFIKDSPEKGGQGYKSMWRLYGHYSQELERMRTVNDGNANKWIRDQKESNKPLRAYIQKHGVNADDYKEVRAFYTTQRMEVAKRILKYVEKVETDIGKLPQVQKMLGPDKKFELKNIHPYGKGFDPPKDE